MHPRFTELRLVSQPENNSPNPITPLIKAAVDETVAALDQRTLPVRQRYLRADGASQFLGIDKTTLAEWRSKGVGPRFRRIGARIVYGVQELIEFVEQHPLVGSGSLEGGNGHGN